MYLQIKELKANRAAAGVAYAQAAAAYIAAAIELAAHDRALASALLEGQPQRGFGDLPTVAPHGDALPSIAPLVGSIHSQIASRADELVTAATFTPYVPPAPPADVGVEATKTA